MIRANTERNKGFNAMTLRRLFVVFGILLEYFASRSSSNQTSRSRVRHSFGRHAGTTQRDHRCSRCRGRTQDINLGHIRSYGCDGGVATRQRIRRPGFWWLLLPERERRHDGHPLARGIRLSRWAGTDHQHAQRWRSSRRLSRVAGERQSQARNKRLRRRVLHLPDRRAKRTTAT